MKMREQFKKEQKQVPTLLLNRKLMKLLNRRRTMKLRSTDEMGKKRQLRHGPDLY
jgi:hypothetical protein